MNKIYTTLLISILLLINVTTIFANPTFNIEDEPLNFLTTEVTLNTEVVEDLKNIKELNTTKTFNLFVENKKIEEKKIRKENEKQQKVSRNAPMSANEDELTMLAKIIYAEARGESYNGKVAVGAVVLNRVKSSRYPNTIRDVIFARNQFSPVSDGSYYSARPGNDEYQAARDALSGIDPTNGSLTFYAYKSVRSSYHESLTHTVTIGNHKFFK